MSDGSVGTIKVYRIVDDQPIVINSADFDSDLHRKELIETSKAPNVESDNRPKRNRFTRTT